VADVIPRLNAALQGRYRVDQKLGEGGMATVYLADDLRHESKVAVKVLRPELAAWSVANASSPRSRRRRTSSIATSYRSSTRARRIPSSST
jgi:serine/threonine protein kinase